MADDQEQGQMARVPADIGRRAHKVLEAMRAAGAPELYAAPRASWAAVIRLALTLGLDQLEEKYPPTGQDEWAKDESRMEKAMKRKDAQFEKAMNQRT